MNSLTWLLDRLDTLEKLSKDEKSSISQQIAGEYELKEMLSQNARSLIDAMREMHMALEFYAGDESGTDDCSVARETLERVGKMFGGKVEAAPKTVPRSEVSVYGSDACKNCETGRITLYVGSTYCIECANNRRD